MGGSTDCPNCPNGGNGGDTFKASDGYTYDYIDTAGFKGWSDLGNITVTNNYHKPISVGSGAYGWNDGSAESFWRDYAPISSSLHTFFNGIINQDIGQAAWGAALIGLDAISFGEGSLAIKGGPGVGQTAKFSIRSARQRAVRQAWKMEKELVEATGEGTRNWGVTQLTQLKETGKVSGFVGHHINSVKGYPLLSGLPNNIEFVTRQEHFIKHFGNFRNPTFGELISRGF